MILFTDNIYTTTISFVLKVGTIYTVILFYKHYYAKHNKIVLAHHSDADYISSEAFKKIILLYYLENSSLFSS